MRLLIRSCSQLEAKGGFFQMRNRLFTSIKRASMGAAACAVLFTAPFLKGDSFDERTVVRFNNPVQIPGQVLPAGTYVFKLSPIPLERDTVQIFNARENRIIATLNTVPVWLQRRSGDAAVTLSETPAGNPPAVHDFFYEGTVRGHQFVYGNR